MGARRPLAPRRRPTTFSARRLNSALAIGRAESNGMLGGEIADERDAWRERESDGYAAGVTVKHPTERGSGGRTRFDRAAEAASNFSSSPMFFAVCGLLVAAWAASYVLAASDTLHHVLADAMAAVTLLLVALLKNAERRAEHAIQGKLDRLAEAMLAERRKHPSDGAE